jgi:DnaA family protein
MIREQLPLPVLPRDTADLNLFHAGPNAEALDAVRRLAAGEPPRRVLLHGPTGCGRTHLLQGAVRRAHESGRRSAYLSLADDFESPELLNGLDSFDLVCIDDLDARVQTQSWALAVLRLLDALRTRDAAVLLAASQPPEHLPVAMPDLRTRLASCAIYALKPLADDDRCTLLQRRARARGLDLADDVAEFLVRRLPRDGASLLRALDVLDRASLAAQRKLTLPFVQSLLGQITAESKDKEK